jgi:flagellin
MGMLSINTNVGALRAADSAHSVNKSMETSMQRLASGKRINSAIDDAAGMQISNRMEAEIRGFNMGYRNAADGQALLATAEGAMAEIHNILQRLREIAVSAATGTNNGSDRDALQSEAQALETEISRISNDTTWAGQQILDATQVGVPNGQFTFHIGPDASDTVTLTIPDLGHDVTTGINISAGRVVTTATLANDYIGVIDNAISYIGTRREKTGAMMNRLDYVMSNLSNMSTNLSLAKGRVEDADFAAESANLARTQVLQQASMSMLAQANASKQNILALVQ